MRVNSRFDNSEFHQPSKDLLERLSWIGRKDRSNPQIRAHNWSVLLYAAETLDADFLSSLSVADLQIHHTPVHAGKAFNHRYLDTLSGSRNYAVWVSGSLSADAWYKDKAGVETSIRWFFTITSKKFKIEKQKL